MEIFTKEALQEKRAKLSPEKLARVRQRLHDGADQALPQAPVSIERVSREGPLPLSFSQERMWFLTQLAPDDPGFNIFAAHRLIGPLDIAVLRRCLDEILRRHEMLRTTFITSSEGDPIQVIHPASPVPLSVIDLREVPDAEREPFARRQAIEEALHPFDIARGPVFRIRLLQVGEDDHVALLSFHHIISDGWSQQVFVRELAALYNAFTQAHPSPLPDLPIQYVDFVYWQRRHFGPEAFDADRRYWKQKLADPLPVLELIADRAHAIRAMTTSQARCTLPWPLVKSLKDLSRQAGVTLFVTLLSAFKTLLYRYTGQTDIIVGSPIANRDQAEIEGLIGLFLNTLVLRTDLSGTPTFMELLERVRQTVLEAFAHKDLPFEQIVHELQPRRDLNRNPLFQVTFIMQDGDNAPPALPGITFSPLFGDSDIELESPDVLGIALRETAEGLSCFLEYRADLVNCQVLDHFQVLLESVVANPRQRLPALCLLLPTERQTLLEGWTRTRAPYPRDMCFQHLFEQQTAATPDAIAVVCEDSHLAYQQLNLRANNLAATLVAHHVEADTVIAILAERGLDFLIAMLAVFKAGGAYMPIDPRYPTQRIQQVLMQSRCPLVLATDDFTSVLAKALADFPETQQPAVLRLSEVVQPDRNVSNLPVRCTPRHLAYVIYTSGSTGLPKGAMVEQRGMINHIYAKIRTLALSEADIVAQTASQSFDISVWQFLAALAIGARTNIFADEIAHDPTRLLQQVACQHITILETVPSLLRAMLEQAAQSELPTFNLASLRWLIPTGEALPPELARQWFKYYPHIPLVNAYGPTECSDDVTHYVMPDPPGLYAARVPIGSPIANMRLYVLDVGLQPVPVGVAGEIYVGGDGVGRGYLHAPHKTAEVFTPDPFSMEAGDRLYQTGDLGYWRPDGHLEFLGRVDHQVKIRGFRIELGEIEAVLSRHPAIQAAIVTARNVEQLSGEKRLVAYVVPRSEATLTIEDLRDVARKHLPDYMLPSAWVFLEALPLTPNGKVDRKALPAPEASLAGSSPEFVAPETPAEITLAEIWQQVLGVDRIGIYDNFFERGGHSLLATQIISRINTAFQVNLPLRSIFEDPVLATLALRIEETLIEELEGTE